MALKSLFDKIIISLEYPYAMLLHLFIFELKCILNYLSKADSIMQVSLFISSCVSAKYNLSLSNKGFSIKMFLKCVLNERVFNNDIVMADSVTLFCVCDLKQLSVLNLSHYLFADSLTFRAALLYFSIKYNSLMLVILLNAAYICP